MSNQTEHTTWLLQRFFRGAKERKGLGFVTRISMIGLAIGVATLTITLAILSGFDREYKKNLLGLGAHAVVLGEGGVDDGAAVEGRIRQESGVTAVQPFVMGEGMVSFSGRMTGAVLKGVEPDNAHVREQLEPLITPRGALPELLGPGAATPGLPAMILGRSLAERLGVHVGETAQVIVMREKLSPLLVSFRVVALLHSGMHEFDNRFVYMERQHARRLFSMGQRDTGLEIFVDQPERIEAFSHALAGKIAFPLYMITWKELNANLFAALKLEKTVFFLIILPIVVAGSLTLVATLIMFILEKRKSIALMRVLGMEKRVLGKLFVYQGLLIALVGVAGGLVFGTVVNLILHFVPLVRLSPEVYFVERLPIEMTWMDTLAIAVSALVISAIATLIPAFKAARLQPAEVLRER